MSEKKLHPLKPFLSVLIIVSSLLAVVFIKMEARRMGYLTLTQLRDFKAKQDEVRQKNRILADLLGPQKLRSFALNRLTLQEVQSGQMIHLSEDGLAVPQ